MAINSVAVATRSSGSGTAAPGCSGTIAFGAIAAVAVRGYGLNVLTHPWNPYFPVLLWLVVLAAAWSVLMGDHWMAVVAVVTASVAAQTHVSYLLNAIAMSVLVLAAMGWRLRRRRAATGRARARSSSRCGIGAVLWVPPFLDQLFRDPGNISDARRPLRQRSAGAGDRTRRGRPRLPPPPRRAVGVRRPRSCTPTRSSIAPGSTTGTPLLGRRWCSRSGSRPLSPPTACDMPDSTRSTSCSRSRSLTGFVSTVRIFGKVWYYLTLWAWGTTLMMVLSMAWTAWCAAAQARSGRGRTGRSDRGDRRARRGDDRRVHGDVDRGRDRARRARTTAVRRTAGGRAVHRGGADRRAIGPAVGPDGRYLVRWNDALLIGSQGYGLVNELERDGYHVGVHETYHVPVTPQRVFDEGTLRRRDPVRVGRVHRRRRAARDGFVEVARADVRTDAERARFDELRDRVLDPTHRGRARGPASTRSTRTCSAHRSIPTCRATSSTT